MKNGAITRSCKGGWAKKKSLYGRLPPETSFPMQKYTFSSPACTAHRPGDATARKRRRIAHNTIVGRYVLHTSTSLGDSSPIRESHPFPFLNFFMIQRSMIGTF